MNRIYRIVSTDGGVWMVNLKNIIRILYDEFTREHIIHLNVSIK